MRVTGPTVVAFRHSRCGREFMFVLNVSEVILTSMAIIHIDFATCIRNAVATIRYGPAEDGVKAREVPMVA